MAASTGDIVGSLKLPVPPAEEIAGGAVARRVIVGMADPAITGLNPAAIRLFQGDQCGVVG